MLTSAQIDRYRTDGFVRLGRVLGADQLEALRADEARVRSTRGEHTAAGRALFYYDLLGGCAAVHALCTRGAHLGAVEQILGTDILLMFCSFVAKLPSEGSGRSAFPWHQDNGYRSIVPDDNPTIWLALDDTNERNGCLRVVPRSHLGSMRPHRPQADDTWYLTIDVADEAISVPMQAGEGVMLTARTVHCSGENETAHVRRALFMQYARTSAIDATTGKPLAGDERCMLIRERASGESPRTRIT